MIDKQLLIQTVQEAIEGTKMFLVDVIINPGNSIVVEIDSYENMDILTCAEITRKIEARFDREVEDYDLEVGSAGLTSPFKVKEQYIKNLNNEIEILTRDGRKMSGVLTHVGDDDFTVEIPTKVKEPGAKRPSIVMQPTTLKYDETKTVKYLINFK